MIILTTGDKVWKRFRTFVIQAMKQGVFTVNTEDFGSGRKSYYFQIGEFGYYASTRHISEAVYTIPGKLFINREFYRNLQ